MLIDPANADTGFVRQCFEQSERRPARGQDPRLRHDLVVFGAGARVPGDAAADAVLGPAAPRILDDGADGDVEPRARPRGARGSEVAHAPAVDAARRILELGDDRHR